MTFARGATLTTATTFGHADTSNLGPTAGNGFYKRWPDDLALLQDLGITDIRFTFDWARLQPKPGEFDGAWSDLFEQILAAADAIGLRVWATLHDGAEPRWVSNEGGLGDDDVTEKWWPRYVEQVADRFGASVAGWIPFAGVDNQPSIAGWRNTWTTLNSSDAPVVAAIDALRIDDIPNYLEISDMIGLVVGHDELTDPKPGDEEFDHLRAQLHDAISQAAESAGDHEIVVAQFAPHHDDPDVAGRVVTAFVDGCDAAIADAVDLGIAFIDPAISGPDSPVGLLSSDRTPQPAAAAYLPRID
jgi:hypothetical protein